MIGARTHGENRAGFGANRHLQAPFYGRHELVLPEFVGHVLGIGIEAQLLQR